MAKRDKSEKSRFNDRQRAVADFNDPQRRALANSQNLGEDCRSSGASPRTSPRKRYGVEFTFLFVGLQRTPSVWTRWYATERARDEAFKSNGGILNNRSCDLRKRRVER